MYTYIREQYYDEKARDKAYEIIYTPWEASCYVDEMCEVILKISIEHAEKVLGELTELVGLSSKKLVDTIKKNAEIMELAREEAEGFCEGFREEYKESFTEFLINARPLVKILRKENEEMQKAFIRITTDSIILHSETEPDQIVPNSQNEFRNTEILIGDSFAAVKHHL